RPIKLHALAGLADLREIHLLGRAVEFAPQLHAPLKRAQGPASRCNPVAAAAQKMLKKGLGIQLRRRLQPAHSGVPQSASQWIRSSSRALGRMPLALLRALLEPQILGRSLAVHTRLYRGVADHAAVVSIGSHKPAILMFGNHRGPCAKGPNCTAYADRRRMLG